jgi:hypothetical protein
MMSHHKHKRHHSEHFPIPSGGQYEVAPIQNGFLVSTDDAYVVGRKPIAVDLRVPAAAEQSVKALDFEQLLYCLGLSIPDLTIYIRGSKYKACGHYRGELVEIEVGSANCNDLLHYVVRRCKEFDALVGGIRLEPIED